MSNKYLKVTGQIITSNGGTQIFMVVKMKKIEEYFIPTDLLKSSSIVKIMKICVLPRDQLQKENTKREYKFENRHYDVAIPFEFKLYSNS